MSQNEEPIYTDPSHPLGERVEDLVSRMTLNEKVSQMMHDAPAIPRLGVPKYNWWNECLHGVARAGVATVFPQAIGMAASWNPALMHRVGTAISDEARAKHHEAVRREDRDIYKGLTFWSPNINIFRDPRWGRGHETFGECPFLTAEIAIPFIKGIQGDDPKYLKAVACVKHYAVHSGPEPDRHHFDARVSPKELRETYLAAFKDCIKEGKVASVMGAYNRVNGEPCSGSKTLLRDILREEWGFDGYTVSDCGAIKDFHENHKVTANSIESAALAVRNGCNLNCGCTYRDLIIAVSTDVLPEEAIDEAVKSLFTIRFRLGMFDPPEMGKYSQVPYEAVDCDEHRELALEMTRQSMVLLKNEGGLLPLAKDSKAIAVIGPNADSRDALLANYFGTPSEYVTPVEGIRRAVSAETKVCYAPGSELVDGPDNPWVGDRDRHLTEALAMAERSDVVILCLGLSARIEGEEGDADISAAGGDRASLDLPDSQARLLKAIHATGKPIVLVLLNGSAMTVNWADEHVPAILEAWYPGQAGGTAIAEVLFGDYNPAGRLPVTFVKSMEQLPPFTDYDMKGRTYRYLEAEPLYPFGFGLSYTTFQYRDLSLGVETVAATENVEVSVNVQNTGERAGDEVVQLYLTDLEASVPVPVRELRGIQRIHLAPGESKTVTVTFTLTPRQMALIDEEGRCVLEPGRFQVSIGGRQPDARSEALATSNVVTAIFEVIGEPTELPY